MSKVITSYLEMCAGVGNPVAKFLLAKGKAFAIGPKTFAGKRGTPQRCYMNATKAALDDDNLLYVEGIVTIHGVPIDHAWNVTQDGKLIDPTINSQGVGEYFGVTFPTGYLLQASLTNGYYGLLGHRSRKTLPALLAQGELQ
jgi:hypothetical protein